MLLDIIRLYTDFHIPIAPQRHKHSRRGWVNTNCPFHQGNPGYHLGYNLEKGYFFCWACGWHPTDVTVQTLAQTGDLDHARKLVKRYAVGQAVIPEEIEREPIRPQTLRWPDGCTAMTDRHKAYLLERRFDPNKLERGWNLMGTGNWGFYSFRIVAPIMFENQAVSWQSRDITDKQVAKYLPCPEEHELLPHKHLLYGLDKAQWKSVVVVEGITGVWRLGPGSVATFGAEFTKSQLLLIAKHFEKILLLFDGDEAGQLAAERMDIALRTYWGLETEILEPIDCDSGNMPDGLAEKIMSEVRGHAL